MKKTVTDRLRLCNAANVKLRMRVRLLTLENQALKAKLERWGRPSKQEVRDRADVRKMQGELLSPGAKEQLANAHRIQLLVATAFDLSVAQLLEKSRSDRCCVARWVAMLLTNELLGIENSEMGFLFFQSRSNWYHGVETLKARMSTEPKLLAKVDELRAAIKLKMEDMNL